MNIQFTFILQTIRSKHTYTQMHTHTETNKRDTSQTCNINHVVAHGKHQLVISSSNKENKKRLII